MKLAPFTTIRMTNKNKKIGILTLQKVANYGGCLQAYALQRCLNNLGFYSEIIDIERPLKKNIKLRKKYGFLIQMIYMIYISMRKFGTYIKNATSFKDIFLQKIKGKKLEFRQFEQDNLVFSNKVYSLKEIKNCQNNYSIIIVGSDQVWNHEFSFVIEPYFLEFIDNGIRKISYAASFGVNSIPNSYFERYANWLKSFDFLSVREKSGADIIKQIANIDASIVLDPTLLIEAKEWNNLINSAHKNEVKYILCYTLSAENDLAIDIAKKIAVNKKYKIIKIGNSKEDINIPNIETRWHVGPLEFLTLIRDAEVIVTNSFHGTAFSLNFGKPFYCTLNKANTRIGRILDLLKLVGLEDRIIYSTSELSQEKIDIAFGSVNMQKLNEERIKSISFLKKALSKIN